MNAVFRALGPQLTVGAAIVLVMALLRGCPDDEGSNVGDIQTGVYTITDWTLNPTSCDAEGDVIASEASQSMLVINRGEAFSTSYIIVGPCTDTADCDRMAAGSPFAPPEGASVFDQAPTEAGWESETLGFVNNDGQCDADVTRHRLTVEGDTARLEFRRYTDLSFAASTRLQDEATCDREDASNAADDAPCTGYEVISATLNAP